MVDQYDLNQGGVGHPGDGGRAAQDDEWLVIDRFRYSQQRVTEKLYEGLWQIQRLRWRRYSWWV